MSRPILYSVHVNPRLSEPYESVRFVKEGFSAPAFLFSSLWAFAQGLWGWALLLLLYNFGVLYAVVSQSAGLSTVIIVDIAVHLIVGFEAGDWLRAKLERKGFLTADITAGESRLRAEQRFFDRAFSATAPL